MFLTKLTVNTSSRQVQRDLADIHDMHRTVMSAYPKMPEGVPVRLEHGVLWRLDASPRGLVQYVQSRTAPEWDRLPDGHLARSAEVRSIQNVLDAIAVGRTFRFRLQANPTMCVHPDGARNIRRRLPLRDPEQQIAWLIGKGRAHGFALPATHLGEPAVTTSSPTRLSGRKKDGTRITVEAVRFDGRLVVTDAAVFTETVVTGIGRAKAYGCGLLSLAPG